MEHEIEPNAVRTTKFGTCWWDLKSFLCCKSLYNAVVVFFGAIQCDLYTDRLTYITKERKERERERETESKRRSSDVKAVREDYAPLYRF